MDRHTVATETPESCCVGPPALWRLQFDFQVIQIRTEIAIMSVAENCWFLLLMANNQEKGNMFPRNKEMHSAFFPPMSYRVPLIVLKFAFNRCHCVLIGITSSFVIGEMLGRKIDNCNVCLYLIIIFLLVVLLSFIF